MRNFKEFQRESRRLWINRARRPGHSSVAACGEAGAVLGHPKLGHAEWKAPWAITRVMDKKMGPGLGAFLTFQCGSRLRGQKSQGTPHRTSDLQREWDSSHPGNTLPLHTPGSRLHPCPTVPAGKLL